MTILITQTLATYLTRDSHSHDRRIEILENRYDFIDLKDMYCDVCHMAK